MKNIPKYIDETRKYIIGTPTSNNCICAYGKANYPELSG